MNTNKQATGSPKRLLAALAVLAVAFVMLAAVPAVDAEGGSVPPTDDATATKVISVTIDGKMTEYTADELDKVTQAINGAASKVTVTILDDFEPVSKKYLNGKTSYEGYIGAIESGKTVVIDGNGKMLTGMVLPFINSVWDSKVDIENLTISKPAIKGVYIGGSMILSASAAGFVAGAYGELTFSGCKVVGGSITNDDTTNSGDSFHYAGALVGYQTALGVNPTLTITDCEINGVNIATKDGYAGALVGYTQIGITVENSKALECTISVTGTDKWKAGNLVGTFTGGSSSVNGCVIKDTVCSVNGIAVDAPGILISMVQNPATSVKCGDLITISPDFKAEEGKELDTFGFSEGTFTGKISNGDDSVSVKDLKAGKDGIKFTKGSITISGTIDVTKNVEITASGTVEIDGVVVAVEEGQTVDVGGLTIKSDGESGTTVTVTDSLTVSEGATLTVAAGATLAVPADKSVGGTGTIVVQGGLDNSADASITCVVEAVEGSTITNKETIDSFVADEVYTKSIVEGDIIIDAVYGSEQRVVVIGNATVKGSLTVHGEIVIEKGATLTVEPGAKVTIDGARTSVIEGTLVLEGDEDTPARFDIEGFAKVEVSGSLSVAGDLTVGENASITFKAGSSTEVGGKFTASKAVVEADASLTVAGAVGGETSFYVSGILTIESEDVSESFNVYFSAAGATLDIRSVVMADGGEITIKDKGTVVLDSSNSEPEAAVYTGTVTISLTSAAGKIMPAGKTLADDVDSEGDVYEVEHAAVLTGLKVVDSMEPVAAVAATSTPAKNVYTMQLSGTVLVDQNIEYTGLGTAVGYATAKIEVADGTTAAVNDALAIGAGVGFSNAGVLKVLSSIDATASGTQNTIVKDESDEPSGLAGTFDSTEWDSAVIKAVAVSATMTNTGRIVLSGEGSVTTAVKVVVDSASFSGAYYETSVTSGTTRIVTYHYVTVDAALAALTAGATDDVKLYGEQTVGADATILSKDTIALGDAQAKLTIGKDATLTVADGGKLVATTDNSVIVKGTLHVDVYKQFVSYINAVDSDVYSYDADAKGVQDNKSWAEWTSIKNALDKAESGQTVTVNPNKETVEIGENTEVKEGVTLDANGKTISVKQTYALTVNGTLDLTKSGSSLTLAAKTPAQPATSTTPAVAAVAGGAVVYDSGIIKYTDDSQIVRNGANLPGAYYSMTENGRTVKYLASYAQGAKDIASAVGRAVTFSADGASAGVVISSDLAITGEKDKAVALTITGAKLTAGTITLSYATVDVASGTVSATFASADGSAKVAGAATGLKAVHGDCTVGDDTVTVLQISGALADVDNAACSATLSGTVYIVGILGVESTLTVADDADVVVAGSADVDAETLSVAGNLVVKSGAVDAVAADVSGGIAVLGGDVTMTTATVSGSIDASNKDTSGSYTGTVSIETAYIGTDAEALGFTTGSDASVIGNIVLSKVAYVSPAATVTSEWTAEGSTIKSTKYVDENGADYLTVFAAVGDVLIADIGKTVPNADFLGWFNAAGKKAVKVASSPAVDGEEVAYVGGTGWDSVVTKINEFVFNVKIVTDGTVSSVTLNGILMSGSGTFNTADPIKAGTYTVAFSAGAGYDVSGMTLSTSQGVPINGFEITVDDSTTSSDRTVTYQLTGGTAAAPSGGSSSGGSDFSGIIDAIDKNTEAVKNQENGGSSDSSLTDILLIVLVVLIVIMAVLVAMRMMRS